METACHDGPPTRAMLGATTAAAVAVRAPRHESERESTPRSVRANEDRARPDALGRALYNRVGVLCSDERGPHRPGEAWCGLYLGGAIFLRTPHARTHAASARTRRACGSTHSRWRWLGALPPIRAFLRMTRRMSTPHTHIHTHTHKDGRQDTRCARELDRPTAGAARARTTGAEPIFCSRRKRRSENMINVSSIMLSDPRRHEHCRAAYAVRGTAHAPRTPFAPGTRITTLQPL